MQVLECDAKKLLSRHAIASPPGIVAATPEEAEAAATRLGREPVFVKAQVGAGESHVWRWHSCRVLGG